MVRGGEGPEHAAAGADAGGQQGHQERAERQQARQHLRPHRCQQLRQQDQLRAQAG